MFHFTDRRLAQKSRYFRYLFYVISGVRLVSYRTWSNEGEPNPFVAKTYRKRQTERVDFDDIFEDLL